MSESAGSRPGRRGVIVVGAGLAGLHAAWLLHRAGADVHVLEARERVGGRTWSQPLGNGTVVERGGEFIAPWQSAIRNLAGELGLELVPHGFSFDRRPAPGREAPAEADLAAVAAWSGARAAALSEDISALDALPPPSEWTRAQTSALHRLETSLTVPLSETSARLNFTGAIERYDPADRIRTGNQAVTIELARRLGDRVELGAVVTGVAYSEDGATVHTADGRGLEGAAVVLALPLPLLLTLELDLPPAVRATAGRTRFGEAAKVHIPLAEPVAPGGMAAAEAHWWCWTSQAADGSSLAAPALSCFAGGPDVVAPGVENALALRPDAVRGEGEVLVTHWARERWTGGSYSAPGVGLTAADEAAWTRPWGPLVFAGEHTAGELAATMNGAVASGARAAEVVRGMLG